jgi:hypothetical protein
MKWRSQQRRNLPKAVYGEGRCQHIIFNATHSACTQSFFAKPSGFDCHYRVSVHFRSLSQAETMARLQRVVSSSKARKEDITILLAGVWVIFLLLAPNSMLDLSG